MSLKSGLSALVLIGGLFSFGAPAMAAPIPPAGGSPEVSTSVEQVGWRCGRGWHVNRWGRCVPNRRVMRCGPGWHLNRYGNCVRNRPVYRACPRGFHLTPRGFCVPN
ncbi:GCG_CRPN prefix-to-repeats domain-containing protein [Phyllobacterium sp. 1468]|uniref:GCG_CRPN prefix-to-repeats domain-containing protein n=1 Tax=Phyllobacterium sp. 1468 TaxID=2817759 RepID=UPI0038620D12